MIAHRADDPEAPVRVSTKQLTAGTSPTERS